MKYAIPIFCLMLAFSGSGLKVTILARDARGVELIAKDGSLRARIFSNSDSLLLDFPIQQRSYLFKPDSYYYLNHSDKTYRVHSYAQLIADFPNKTNSDMRKTGFKLTEETDLIAGMRANRIVRTSQDKVEIEIWISEEITPTSLRVVRQEFRNRLPENYWDDSNRVPTLIQTILVFGVPLRIVDHQNKSIDVEAVVMKKEDITNNLFEIPSEYRQIVNTSQ